MTSLTTVGDRYSAEEIDTFYAEGFWKRESFYELAVRHAEERPGHMFVFDSTTALTYADFRIQALRLAVGLRRRGIGRGDRMAAQLPNWTEFPVLAAALARIGAVLIPIMPIYRGDEVGYVLRHSGAVAAVTCESFHGFAHLEMFSGLAGDCPDLRLLLAARASADLDPAVATPLADLFADGDLASLENEAGPDGSPDDPFFVVYTSGTTSRPKGCLHTFNTVRYSAETIGRALGYTEAEVQFGPSPVTHSTGLAMSVIMPMAAGAASHLMESWDPEDGIRRIVEHGCTVTVTATPFLQMLMSVYDPAKHPKLPLRAWICAGSPIPASVVERAGELFSGCRTLSLYGRSENMLTTMCTLQDDPHKAAECDGHAQPGAAIKIVGWDGLETPHGEEGDIAYKGPGHMLEYFQDTGQTAELFTDDGFSRSGDLGRMDADGYVRVTGRLKDIVIRGGTNISARELEDRLLTHPLVKDVAVVGMPDERLGERVCAYVVPAGDGLTLEEVVRFLRGHEIATQKLPERLELTAELPMTATGKIQKHLLRSDIVRKLDDER